MDNVVLSIVVPIYNHEAYLLSALNSILQQEIPYTFEVLVGEDCSTDSSRTILKQYELSAPCNYLFFYNTHNQGMLRNIAGLFKHTSGKYATILEGDDLWYDPLKIAAQIEYLESHPDYSGCAHRVYIIDCNSDIVQEAYSAETDSPEYTLDDFLRGKLPGQTSSFLYRNYFNKDTIFQCMESCPNYPLDRFIAFIVAFNGRVMHSPQKSSAYRLITRGGSSYSANQDCTTSEFADSALTFHRALYRYSLSHPVNVKGIQVSEKLYFKSLLRDAVFKRPSQLIAFLKELGDAVYPIKTMIWIVAQTVKYCVFPRCRKKKSRGNND